MSHISNAIDQLHAVDYEARSNGWLQRLHPLTKLAVTIIYLVVLVSFPKYQVAGVLLMAVYPIALCILGDVSIRLMWRRIWVVLLLVCFVGMFNPFFDHTPLIKMGSYTITGGMMSFLSLLIKGCLAVMAAYLLMLTTSMEALCQAFRKCHVPAVLVTVLMLIYRYLMVFLHEVERMSEAYTLRAPGQRGVNMKVWGSMIGQLLLRSIDRAETVYGSMTLRGFQGEFFTERSQRMSSTDCLYAFWWIVFLLVIRLL